MPPPGPVFRCHVLSGPGRGASCLQGEITGRGAPRLLPARYPRGRGSPARRGAITGGGTFAGGIVHTLPFLISGYSAAIGAALAVVASELVVLAWLRHRFFRTSFARSFLAITVGGAIIAALSSALGIAAVR